MAILLRRAAYPNTALTDAPHATERCFYIIAALLFASSAAATVDWCDAMAQMGGMQMPGGWTMSMAWMRLPGQSWWEATVSFLEMWIVMTIAMMLPTVGGAFACLHRSRRAQARNRAGLQTAVAGAGYLAVWAAIGVPTYAIGAWGADWEMGNGEIARAVPLAASLFVVAMGAWQFSGWKARSLASCRGVHGNPRDTGTGAFAALRRGAELGIRCAACCGNLMAVLMVVGVMDLRAMLVVSTAIAAERLAPDAPRVAKGIGLLVACGGLAALVQAIAFRS